MSTVLIWLSILPLMEGGVDGEHSLEALNEDEARLQG